MATLKSLRDRKKADANLETLKIGSIMILWICQAIFEPFWVVVILPKKFEEDNSIQNNLFMDTLVHHIFHLENDPKS